MVRKHQSQLLPAENKFHVGNGENGKHYWLTPPELYEQLNAEFHFDFDPCPYPLPEGFDGLTCEWGRSNYVNPPFGSIIHEGRKKGPTAWIRKAIAEWQKGKCVVLVYPVDKWVLMLLRSILGEHAQVRNLGDVRWLAIEDRSRGKGTGRHIACFILDHKMNEGIPHFLRVANRGKPMVAQSKPLVHSFSSLNCYAEVCPHQYWHRYVLKDIKFVETAAIKEGNEGHIAFERRLSGEKKPFPPHLQHCEKFAVPFDKYKLHVEIKLGITFEGKSCDFFADDVWLRGKIDCVASNGSPVAYLPDWKFSKAGNSRWEKPFELEVNALLLQARVPVARNIKGRFAWIKENRWGEEYDLSDTAAARNNVNHIVMQITNDLQTQSFAKRPSGLCGFCDVRSCEHNHKKQ